MKKTRNLIVGLVLILGGMSLAIFSSQRGASLTKSPETWGMVFGMGFAGGRMLFPFFKPNSRKIEKDELTKKIGYTSLALAAQIICFFGYLAFVIDFAYPFLEQYTAFDALLVTVNGIVITTFLAWLYYSKHPEKTGL